MSRIYWRSWSAECAEFDMQRISKLEMRHEWRNGHPNSAGYEPPDPHADVLLTGNGDDCDGSYRAKATIYAEPYIYLRSQYDNFPNDKRWDFRFVYNPDLLRYPHTRKLPVAGYWRSDLRQFAVSKDVTFGMVLSKKPPSKIIYKGTEDITQIRTDFVSALRGHNFMYWGSGWDAADPAYQGEHYTNRTYPDQRMHDSQGLLARCRFALALDNSILNGYHTEKFWNALVAGCIPIYYGHPSIKDIAPPDAFIYGYDFESVHDVIKHCESMFMSRYVEMWEAGAKLLNADRKHSWDAIFQHIDHNLP